MISVDKITNSVCKAVFEVEAMGFRHEEILISIPEYFYHFYTYVNRNILSTDCNNGNVQLKFMGCKTVSNYQNNIAVYHPEMVRRKKDAIIIELPEM